MSLDHLAKEQNPVIIAFRSGAQATLRFDRAGLGHLLRDWQKALTGEEISCPACYHARRNKADRIGFRLLIDPHAIEAVYLLADDAPSGGVREALRAEAMLVGPTG